MTVQAGETESRIARGLKELLMDFLPRNIRGKSERLSRTWGARLDTVLDQSPGLL